MTGTADRGTGAALDAVESFCRSADLPVVREPRRVGFQLRGERKLAIAVLVTEADAALRFESFFMRKPLDDPDRFYAMLLGRNARARGVAFALDAAGDVYLVAHLPVAAVADAELDRLVGAFLVESDGMFDAAMRVGFASYLEADLAWRAKQAPPPASD